MAPNVKTASLLASITQRSAADLSVSMNYSGSSISFTYVLSFCHVTYMSQIWPVSESYLTLNFSQNKSEFLISISGWMCLFRRSIRLMEFLLRVTM